MTLNCSVSSSAPATTNVVMGYVGQNSYYLDLSTASAEDVKVVTNFLQVSGKHINVDVENYNIDSTFEANIIVPEECTLETITIDFESLNQSNKDAINGFVNLIKSLI